MGFTSSVSMLASHRCQLLPIVGCGFQRSILTHQNMRHLTVGKSKQVCPHFVPADKADDGRYRWYIVTDEATSFMLKKPKATWEHHRAPAVIRYEISVMYCGLGSHLLEFCCVILVYPWRTFITSISIKEEIMFQVVVHKYIIVIQQWLNASYVTWRSIRPVPLLFCPSNEGQGRAKSSHTKSQPILTQIPTDSSARLRRK